MTTDSLFLRALTGQSTPRPPVWLMRQAGRYMPEYRELKARHSFLELCRRPELAAEVTMQPIRYLDVDAAIIFSDILIPLTGMGFQVDFNPGPFIANPVAAALDVDRVVIPSDDPQTFVYDALRRVADLLRGSGKALLGFAGAPWTLACYAIEKGPYKHFENAQIFAAQHPSAMALLLSRFAQVVSEYLCNQLAAGADAVQLFDSWGGNLSVEDYRRWSLPTITQIVSAVRSRGGKTILYVGNSRHLLSALGESGADAVSLDWRVSFDEASSALGPEMPLQGNLDPTALCAAPQTVVSSTEEMLRHAPKRGYIANLGHGILQTTPPENVKLFVDTVKRFSA